jgi:hypothetical protein
MTLFSPVILGEDTQVTPVLIEPSSDYVTSAPALLFQFFPNVPFFLSLKFTTLQEKIRLGQ